MLQRNSAKRKKKDSELISANWMERQLSAKISLVDLILLMIKTVKVSKLKDKDWIVKEGKNLCQPKKMNLPERVRLTKLNLKVWNWKDIKWKILLRLISLKDCTKRQKWWRQLDLEGATFTSITILIFLLVGSLKNRHLFEGSSLTIKIRTKTWVEGKFSSINAELTTLWFLKNELWFFNNCFFIFNDVKSSPWII